MRSIPLVQSKYLDSLIEDQKPVMLYFKNGSKIMGVIIGITDEVMFFKYGITEYFYNSTIHSVVPIM